MKPDSHRSRVVEYIDAAEEDIRSAHALLTMSIGAHHNVCMLSARASEKILKARLIFEGKDVDWVHDQRKLVRELGDFEGRQRAMEIAEALSPYAVQANYPSVIRSGLDEDDALEAYEMASEMFSMLHPSGVSPVHAIDTGDGDIQGCGDKRHDRRQLHRGVDGGPAVPSRGEVRHRR
ncbi:MAG: HEPN domain-containing protein [Candidatus Methanomethylophilaceae archaeon]|nr:HEPN domain-containing protein [Candidatus Methanomethylophilaceae archaeon]